jgi:hypothetical protein
MASHCGSPDLHPGQPMWDLWCTEWYWDIFFSKGFAFQLSVSFHHCSTFTHVSSGRWKMGQSAAALPQSHQIVTIKQRGLLPDNEKVFVLKTADMKGVRTVVSWGTLSCTWSSIRRTWSQSVMGWTVTISDQNTAVRGASTKHTVLVGPNIRTNFFTFAHG